MIDLDPVLELTGKRTVSVDFIGITTGVNADLVLSVGPGKKWSQLPPVGGTWTAAQDVEFDLTALTASCKAGLSEVHGVGMWTHAGVHTYGSLIAQ